MFLFVFLPALAAFPSRTLRPVFPNFQTSAEMHYVTPSWDSINF